MRSEVAQKKSKGLGVGTRRVISNIVLVILSFLRLFWFYFMFIYNAALDKIMFLNVLQTDVYEVRDLLSPKLILIMLFFGIFPAWLICKTRVSPTPLKRQFAAAGGAVALIAAIMLGNFAATDAFLRSNRNLRYYLTPSNYIGSIISVIKIKARPLPDLVKIAEDATLNRYWKNDKKNLFVFVMGETARAVPQFHIRV